MDVRVEYSWPVLEQGGRVPDACDLFLAWAREEDREDTVDKEGYAKYLLSNILNGSYVIIVAYVDDNPAGMLGAHVIYDPSISARIGIGERLYILPQYRAQGVLGPLLDATDTVGAEVGITEFVASFRSKDHRLKDMYERRGYTETNVVMRKGVYDYTKRD